MKNEKTTPVLFEVSGQLLQKATQPKKFSKTVRAFNESHAIEKTRVLFGSKNKIKRRYIQIEKAHRHGEKK